MRRMILCLVLMSAACRSARNDRLVIVADRMLDPIAGRYVANAVVYLDGDRIARVTRDQPPSASYGRVIRVRTLVPGLIDAHTHLAWTGAPGDDAARATLEAGFTTVRNLGSNGDEDLALRASAAAPRILLSGPGLGPKGGTCHQTFGDGAIVTGPDDARDKVRAQIRDRHADLIKVCAGGGVVSSPGDKETIELDPETLAAIVSEAHAQGKKVAAHAQGPQAIRNAVMAGVDSIEHGGGIDREIAALMRDRGVAFVPTLARLNVRLETAKAQGASPEVLERVQENRKRIFANAREAIATGVTIVCGSDATVLPHGRNAEELQALVEAGLSPLEAIRAATTNAAALLGVPNVGCVARDCAADLVAVDGDPLQDVSALSHPRLVIAKGRVILNPAAAQSAAK